MYTMCNVYTKPGSLTFSLEFKTRLSFSRDTLLVLLPHLNFMKKRFVPLINNNHLSTLLQPGFLALLDPRGFWSGAKYDSVFPALADVAISEGKNAGSMQQLTANVTIL